MGERVIWIHSSEWQRCYDSALRGLYRQCRFITTIDNSSSSRNKSIFLELFFFTPHINIRCFPLSGHCYGLRDEGEEPHQQCAVLLQERPKQSHPDPQKPGQNQAFSTVCQSVFCKHFCLKRWQRSVMFTINALQLKSHLLVKWCRKKFYRPFHHFTLDSLQN